MSNIQIFNNPQFGEIRISINESNEPLFCLADVCKALDIVNQTNVKNRLNQRGVRQMDTLTAGGYQSLTYIDEGNLYKCVIRSDKSQAESFQEWVCYDVLPSIRKHGAYLTPEKIEEVLLNPDMLIQLATTLKEEQQKRIVAEEEKERLRLIASKQEEELKESAPKVQYHDNVLSSKGLMTINTIANDLGISAVKLNKILVENKIQYKENNTYVLYSKYRELGLVKHIPYIYLDKNGESRTAQHMYWTELGRKFIYELIKNNQAA